MKDDDYTWQLLIGRFVGASAAAVAKDKQDNKSITPLDYGNKQRFRQT